MKYEIKNGYIYVKNENLHIGEKYVLDMSGMKLDGKTNLWRGRDDGLKRIMLDIPLEDAKINDVDKVTFKPLKPFQREDVKKMVETGCILNANVMGLGKTLETIVTLNMLGCNRVLIICPKSVKGTWKNELQKWTNIPTHLINIIDGTPKQVEKQLENLHVPYTIVNYERLRPTKTSNKKETNKVLKAIRDIKWDAIVCDEAHRIKNAKAKQTKGIKSLKSDYRIALTGTPIQNKPNDLWSILHWINPYYSGQSYWRFVEYFCETFDNGFGTQIAGLTKDPERVEALGKLLSNIMIRRENDDSMPRVINVPVNILMTSKQKKLYEKVKKEILVELEGLDQTLFINSSLTRMLRLQQCTSNPELLGIKTNPKFDYIVDILKDYDDKTVVFSKFKETIKALSKRLEKEKIKHVVLTGDTKDRQEVINKFINDDDQKCFIATTGAAGEGIDGLQYVSNRMIFIDKEWSPAKNQQAVGRLVRTGQKNPVTVLSLNCENTIDEYVEKMLNKKIEDIIKILSSTD